MRRHRNPGEDNLDQVDLSSLDEDFAAAPALTPIPDGRYHVRVERVEIAATRIARRPSLRWTLRILGPAREGRLLWKTSVLATPENLRWLKHDLTLCGLHLEKLSDLPAHLARLLDVELDVTKRTQGEWENVHFNRRLSTSDHNRPPPF